MSTFLDWLLEPGSTHLGVAVFFGFVAFVSMCALVSFAPQLARQQERDEQVINPSPKRVTSARKSGRVAR